MHFLGRNDVVCGDASKDAIMSVMKKRIKKTETFIRQTGYLPRPPTVLKVLSDILMAIDEGDLAMFVMLELSAAFDSVD